MLTPAAPLVIDLALHGGPVYCGRAAGEALRAQLRLDEADTRAQPLVLQAPDNTYTVSSGFFLGLLGPSIRLAGSPEAFAHRVALEVPTHLLDSLQGWVRAALAPRLRPPAA